MKTSLPYIANELTSFALVVAPWSVSVLTVVLQCSHFVFELAVGLHSVPFLGVGIQEHTHKEKNGFIPDLSPCCTYMLLSVGT